MNKLQRGFTIVESLLLVLIVAVIGFGGYYVWHTQHKTKPAGTPKNIAATTRTTTPVDLTDSWLLYNDPNGYYSVRIADGWTLSRPSNTSSYLIGNVPANITYQNSKTATVATVEGGRDGPIAFTLYVAGQEGSSPFSPTDAGVKQTGFVTAQGLAVNKYLFTQVTDPEGPGIPKGGRGYYYVVSKGSTTIVVGHDESPGDPDNVKTVEQVVKTIEL